MSDRQMEAIKEIVRIMKSTGNRAGVVTQWVSAAVQWAEKNPGADGQAVKDWIAHWQVRPFYAPIELVPLIPALSVGLGVLDKPLPQFSAARLDNMLTFAGLPKLQRAGGGYWFRHPYRLEAEQFFIVEQIHLWKNRKLTQEEFLNVAFGG